MMVDFTQMDTQKCHEYIQALEDERRKIQVFQRELPLCFELVTQALETYKQQLSRTSTTTGHSECSDQTSSDGPVLEEFIPLKRSSSTDDEDDHHDEHEELDEDHITENQNNDNQHDEKTTNSDKSAGKKSDWLRSVQLWNQTPDPASNQEVHEHQPKRVPVVEVNRNGGGAFHPFRKEDKSNGVSTNKPVSAPAASACSSAEAAASGGSGGNNVKKEEKDGQSQRKQRRCWSPELHRRFLHALQQLGGSHAATPKQIRELMKVDGLTNDEVKSHLQKYRLHTRRPSATIHTNANQQAPQFVVVGGIWVPPPEYSAVAASANTTGDTTVVASTSNSRIYAPVAAVPPPPAPLQSSTVVSQRLAHKKEQSSQQSHCEERGSQSEHSNSPATSSSTHTSDTTASHAY